MFNLKEKFINTTSHLLFYSMHIIVENTCKYNVWRWYKKLRLASDQAL